jgi:hypothetical protein
MITTNLGRATYRWIDRNQLGEPIPSTIRYNRSESGLRMSGEDKDVADAPSGLPASKTHISRDLWIGVRLLLAIEAGLVLLAWLVYQWIH